MSTFIANATVAVKRGTTTNDIGDEVDTPLLVTGYDRVPVSLIEKSKRVYLPDSGELRTIRYELGRVSPVWRIQKGDLLVDQRSGITHVVDQVTPGRRGIAGIIETTFDARQTTIDP